MIELRTQNEIMKSWKGNYDEPLVTVRCMTYNQEPYIEDAITGFLIQETNFPFQIIIHDDASTDNTAKILKKYEEKYPQIIKVWYQTQNSYRLPPDEKSALRKPFHDMIKGKYIALCEGDDYWTDPLKLQKQVDLLEANPQCSMCCHRAKVQHLDGRTWETPDFGSVYPFPQDRIFFEGGSSVTTASMMARQELCVNLPSWKKTAPVGDMPLKLWLSENGNIAFLSDVMSVRRLGNQGSWNDRIRGTKKEKDYLIGMINMLAEYKKTTTKRKSDIIRKMMFYERQLEKKFGMNGYLLKNKIVSKWDYAANKLALRINRSITKMSRKQPEKHDN